jgi:glycosyltransferase involved in cell wall biosynthesis
MALPSTTASLQPIDVLLVLPAYRELNRLPRYLSSLTSALSTAPWKTEILVVDDGSPDGEQEALSRQLRPGTSGTCRVLPLMRLARNRLKGDAILEGWRSRPAKWLAFADSDGATDAGEVLRVLAEIGAGDPSAACAYFGVRQVSGPRASHRSATRRLLSSAFSRLAGIALGARPIDFQCGFKVIPGQVLARIEGNLENRGLCFDLALFLSLRSEAVPVNPVPVAWNEVPDGRISPWRNGPGMVAGLWSLAVRGPGARTYH